MFKNLSGFKKVKEDKDSVVMEHPKGHKITVALKALPAVHREQIKRLPMCAGGEVKMAEGGDLVDYGQNQTPVVQDYTAAPYSRWNDLTTSLPSSPNIDASDSSINQGAAAAEESGLGQTSQSVPSNLVASNGPMPADALPQTPIEVNSEGAGSQQPTANMAMNPQGIFGQEAQGIKEKANAEASQAKQQAGLEQQYQQTLQQAQDNWAQNSKQMQDEIMNVVGDVDRKVINPKHYLENMGTTSKVATAIGLLLGGIGGGITGTSNPAMDFLNKQIDRDIESQKAQQQNRQTIYHAYLEKYHNAQIADSMARATQYGIYASQLKQAAAQNGSALAQAQAKINLGELEQRALPWVMKSNFLQNVGQIDQAAARTGSKSPIPPEKLVQYSGAPQQDQQKMFEEIKDRQIINKISNPILNAFDQAAKEVRPLSGGINTSGTAFIPGMDSAAQKKWEALINTTIKETEQTTRAAAFKSVKDNLLPQFGDNDSTIKSKRAGLIEYLKSHAAAPVSKGYGIDLDNYQSTASAQPRQFIPGQILYVKDQPVRVLNARGDYAPVTNAKP